MNFFNRDAFLIVVLYNADASQLPQPQVSPHNHRTGEGWVLDTEGTGKENPLSDFLCEGTHTPDLAL